MAARAQTYKEEMANAFSHFLGIVFCLVSMPYLLFLTYKAHGTPMFFAVFMYGLGMLLVYVFSTTYHYVQNVKLKKHLKKADHISIFFLIAGTYTPHVLFYLEANLAYYFLIILWSIVALGFVYKLWFINSLQWFSVLLYLSMGWMVLFVIKPMLENMPMPIFWWILAGGISYTIGVYFYVKSSKLYYHTIWHVFVLLGTILHFMSVYWSV